ncbi:uncharacterized protein IL334_000876 [Kwoniella shivajii]|uniref:Phosphatidylinositol-specific phospholipase C X domain-containing protein n=1 Tax=Kwoniella shivajii TaxID=564305 RepID=A0ABZ1CRZ2_9TREE|nr:hypothetical protein IL334_000876 [Kwoniella shivajii]
MEVVAPNIILVSANITSNHPRDFQIHSVQFQTLKHGRFILTVPTPDEAGTVDITFHSAFNEKDIGKLSLKCRPSKSLKTRGWKRIKVNEGSFSAYRLYRHSNDSIGDSLIILEKPDTANFLSRIPDNTHLGDITLPGTHESCALYGFPISQCQQPSTPIEQQLFDGVRFLDVRLRVVDDELLMYHGPRPQRSSLTLLLRVLHDFLGSHPSETIILSIKEETPPWHPHFSQILYKAFEPFLDRWFLEERIPTLGEVRGKGMLLTRFDKDKDGNGLWEKGMGIHPSTWPDSRKDGFEWECNGTTVRTQDWYRVHTFLEIPEKLDAITSHLLPTLRPPVLSTFTLSYLSASFFPLSFPTVIAKGFGFPAWGLGVEGINSRMCEWILERVVNREKVRACLAIDFYRQCAGDAGLAELLVQMNFIDHEQYT